MTDLHPEPARALDDIAGSGHVGEGVGAERPSGAGTGRQSTGGTSFAWGTPGVVALATTVVTAAATRSALPVLVAATAALLRRRPAAAVGVVTAIGAITLGRATAAFDALVPDELGSYAGWALVAMEPPAGRIGHPDRRRDRR